MVEHPWPAPILISTAIKAWYLNNRAKSSKADPDESASLQWGSHLGVAGLLVGCDANFHATHQLLERVFLLIDAQDVIEND